MVVRLRERGARVQAFDPAVPAAKGATDARLEGIEVSDDAYAATEGAHALVILTEWDDFRWMDFDKVRGSMAEPRVVELLVTSGVRLVTWSLPAELDEPRSGDPITHDDLLDFHEVLESDDWMDAIVAMTKGVTG